MMNINVNDEHAYIEVEVFGQYQPDRLPEVLDAMRRLADTHGHFSELEVHHGKVQNMFSAMRALGAGGAADDYAFMRKLRKYAVVSDNPGFFLRALAFFARFGPLDMRLFPMHERDHARQWIETGEAKTMTNVPSEGPWSRSA